MNSLRWTAQQLEEYQKRQAKPIEIPILTASQPWQQKESKLERRIVQQLAESPDIPAAQRNYLFLPDRDFELDFCWPALRVGLEVQGQAHRIKGKFKADIEKRALAMLAGWKVLEVGGDQVRSGQALAWLRMLLAR